jgi:hypothetical protein
MHYPHRRRQRPGEEGGDRGRAYPDLRRCASRASGQAGPPVLFDHVKLRRRYSGFRSLRSVTVMDGCLPSAWNGSWNDALDNPSVASAVSAIFCVIRASSAHGARGRTSCKRQVTSSTAIQVGHNHALIALLTVAARDKRAHCNWLEQLQIDAPMSVNGSDDVLVLEFPGLGKCFYGWAAGCGQDRH